MKTLHFYLTPELRNSAVDAMVATPLSRRSLAMVMAKAKDILLNSDTLVQDHFPFTGESLLDEEGNSYPKVSFEVLNVYEVDGDRWISGTEFRINLSEYFRLTDEILNEALSKKSDNSDALDIADFFGVV